MCCSINQRMFFQVNSIFVSRCKHESLNTPFGLRLPVSPSTSCAVTFRNKAGSCSGMYRRSAAALSTHILYIPMIHYVHWLKSMHLTLTHTRAHTRTHAHTHTLHAPSLLCSLWMGVVFFSSAALWRWKATWSFYPPLAETFATDKCACWHTHTHTHTHTHKRTHTLTHTQPCISTSNIPFHFLLDPGALSCATHTKTDDTNGT